MRLFLVCSLLSYYDMRIWQKAPFINLTRSSFINNEQTSHSKFKDTKSLFSCRRTIQPSRAFSPQQFHLTLLHLQLASLLLMSARKCVTFKCFYCHKGLNLPLQFTLYVCLYYITFKGTKYIKYGFTN